MKKEDISEIKVLLSTPKKIVIIPHRNPDGDAIGSTLGLMHYLKQYNHEVTVVAPNDYPHFLKWVPGESTIVKFDTQNKISEELINNANIIFTLDFNALHRTGDDMGHFLESNNTLKIMIDHHQAPDNYAKYMYSDVNMSSTCEMVYNFIELLGDANKITSEIATCIYVGIMTDTGSFKYSSTTSKTHHIIAELINLGADNSKIHDLIYDNYSEKRTKLLGYCLNDKLQIFPELNSAIISLTEEELKKFNFKKGDTEGVVNYALAIKGIIFAVFIAEKEGVVKLSLRSKGDFKVNEIAKKYFSGGGHMNASGGISDLSVNKSIEKVISIFKENKINLTK